MDVTQISTTDLPDYGPVIPVITIDNADIAVPLATALVAGGVKVLEVTLRTTAALAAIEAIARNVPDAIVGAGTVLTAADASASAAAGAMFAVSPGFTVSIANACATADLPLLPGVSSGSEVMAAMDAGFNFLKFFPAGPAGGPDMLKALSGPFTQTRFCPTGGINPANAAQYLSLPNVLCVGGSWLTPASLLASHDWPAITALAKNAASLRKGQAKPSHF
ncbi:MAG: bifunctional 4-hydroxy-2-oxoglutarate aldolase/2-dehydro-3-deoxy-phosphogluconate aldolase [Burkholderiaceae bacterium]